MGNTPNIRFKGFTDDWEQRKLSDAIVDIADGPFGSNLKTEHYTDEKEARIIQLSNLSDYGWQEPNTRYTTFEHAKEIRRCIVNEGELVMGKMMPAGMTIIRPNTEKMYVLSSDCVRIKLDKNVATDEFFLYTTKSETFLNQVNNDSQGSTRVRTSISKIREMDFATPSLEEQAKIGEYFTNLDNLITLHQRKCDETKELKKFMLQKMFPKNGEKKPEIRFEGFTDDWEQRKLGELASFSKGSGYSKSDLTDAGTPIILYGRLYTKYETVISKVDTFADAKSGSVYSKGGEVIVPGSGETAEDISIASVVENAGVLLGGDLNIITPPEEIDSAFLAISISNGKPHKDMAKMAQGKSVVHLHNSDLGKIDLPYPSMEEQRKISGTFANLDNLITLHQCKCDEIKEIKKFMLQNMFPQKG